MAGWRLGTRSSCKIICLQRHILLCVSSEHLAATLSTTGCAGVPLGRPAERQQAARRIDVPDPDGRRHVPPGRPRRKRDHCRDPIGGGAPWLLLPNRFVVPTRRACDGAQLPVIGDPSCAVHYRSLHGKAAPEKPESGAFRPRPSCRNERFSRRCSLQVLLWDLRGNVGVSASLGSGSHASHSIIQVRTHVARAIAALCIVHSQAPPQRQRSASAQFQRSNARNTSPMTRMTGQC
jgi:hypothetical protein